MDNVTDKMREEQLELERVAEFVRDHLEARNYQFLFLIQGKTGQCFSCEIADWAVIGLIKKFFTDKRYKFNFWKKLYILFG